MVFINASTSVCPEQSHGIFTLLFTPQNRAPAARLLADTVHSASEGASPKANLIATERYCSRVANP
jgi:hypothetical protein